MTRTRTCKAATGTARALAGQWPGQAAPAGGARAPGGASQPVLRCHPVIRCHSSGSDRLMSHRYSHRASAGGDHHVILYASVPVCVPTMYIVTGKKVKFSVKSHLLFVCLKIGFLTGSVRQKKRTDTENLLYRVSGPIPIFFQWAQLKRASD